MPEIRDRGRDLLGLLDLERWRTNEERSWELPPWRHPISAGVAPLFVATNGFLHPLGTAFMISSLRIILTAHHNLLFALGYHRSAQRARDAVVDESQENYSLDDLNLYVLLQGFDPDGSPQTKLWSVVSTVTPRPADLAYGLLGRSEDDPFRFLTLPLSPAVPRCGSRVWSVGYCKIEVPQGGIPLAEIADGSFNWEEDYSHRLMVFEAEVDLVFSRRLAKGFVEGPCVRINTVIPHGLSGGPVISDQGYVCGINTSGSSIFFDQPSSLVSILYPSMLSRLELLAFNALDPTESSPVGVSIFDLVKLGKIATDGSEFLLGQSQQADGTMVHPFIHEEDLSKAFESFEDFQRDSPAPRYFEGAEMRKLVMGERALGDHDDG